MSAWASATARCPSPGLPCLSRAGLATSETNWQPHGWADADGDGCNTREEVLIAQSRTPVATGAGCKILAGEWLDPFTGRVTTAASQLEVDHLVALADAHRSGGWDWPPERKVAFANDLDTPELHAVWGPENQAKADDGPDGWLPPNQAWRCQYVLAYATVKVRWDLTATAEQWAAMQRVWADCQAVASATIPSASPAGESGVTGSAEARHRITVVLRGDELVDVLDALAALRRRPPHEVVGELVEAQLRLAGQDPDIDRLVRARRRRRARRRGLRLVWGEAPSATNTLTPMRRPSSWPAQPAHGEFVVLPLDVPPTLLEAVGYDGDARYVALWHLGDDVMVSDASSTRSGRWRGLEAFIAHPLGRALLGPYQLMAGADGGDPYIGAPHRLLVDRWEQSVAVGEAADVEAFIRSQPNTLAALTEGMEPSAVEALVTEHLHRTPHVDVEAVLAGMAAADEACEAVERWLDARLQEVRDAGESPSDR